MKTALIALVCLLFSYESIAQCENAYFPFEEGVSYELTSYKSNGKELGRTKSEIAEAHLSNAVMVKNEMYDKKGKLISEGMFQVICEDGSVKMDMQNFIPEDLRKNYENMEMTMEGDFLEIPSDLEVGEKLPDGTGVLTIKMGGGGMDMDVKVNIKFTDREVEKKETITTPAGTFDTYKITQTTNVDTNMMGMNQSSSMTSANWIAQGIGTVRSENYDKKGELDSYSLLTDFSK